MGFEPTPKTACLRIETRSFQAIYHVISALSISDSGQGTLDTGTGTLPERAMNRQWHRNLRRVEKHSRSPDPRCHSFSVSVG